MRPLPSSGVSVACTPNSHEVLPSGQSVPSIVYVPASKCTLLIKFAHELTSVLVEPLNRYVPGDGSVTITPGSVPNVLGRPVTCEYRFASSPPPPKAGVVGSHPLVSGVAGFELDSEIAVLRGGRGLSTQDFEAQVDGAGRDCHGIAARDDLIA